MALVVLSPAAQEAAPSLDDCVAEFGRALLDAEPARVRDARREMEALVFAAGARDAASDPGTLCDALMRLLESLTDEARAVDVPLEDEALRSAPYGGKMPPLLSIFAFPEAARQAAARARIDQARRDLMFWISLVIDEGRAAALAPHLNDSALGEETISALARVGGESAGRVLIEALKTAPAPLRLSVIRTLGTCGIRDAVPALTTIARGEDGEARWCAVDALSVLGVPGTAVFPLDPRTPPSLAARYAASCLRAALVLGDRGERRDAERLIERFVDLNARRHQICAALLGLSRLGSTAVTRHALGFIGTPGVRATAIDVIVADCAPGVEDTLIKAYPVTDPSMQAAILEVLTRRQSPRAPGLLQQALNASHAEVRVAAARLQGLDPVEADLWPLAERGAPWIRHDALRLFLELAWRRAAAGQKDVAREQFIAVLQGRFPPEARREALNGLERLADAATRPVLERWARDPDVAEAATCALVAIISVAPDDEEARGELLELARTTPHEAAASAAVTALAARGADVAPLVRQQGYITDWRVLGPFPNDAAALAALDAALGHAPPRTAAVPRVARPADPPATVSHEGAEFVWRDVHAAGLPAVVDIEAVFGPYTQAAAYGFAKVAQAQRCSAVIHLVRDDPITIWVNGKQVYESGGSRGLDAPQERVHITLETGWNCFLVRVLQDAGPWGYGIRLTDRQGAPIDLEAQAMPDDGMAGIGVTRDALRPVLSGDAP
ncbi:MAG TPA: hypothetical protein PKI11_02695 [Candidatus Hydrogenedentes bacterium]|nr:hypothetical protein [Candidatus Hydrogenedentota bacterium]